MTRKKTPQAIEKCDTEMKRTQQKIQQYGIRNRIEQISHSINNGFRRLHC